MITRNLDTAKLLKLIQPRIEKFSQIPGQIGFFENLPEFGSELFVNKGQKASIESTQQILPAAIEALGESTQWTNEVLFEQLKALSATLGLKTGTVMWAVRIAISGTAATPGGATEILEILGKEESLRRLNLGLAKVNTLAG